ncbi:MAG TPA: XRE family transcriptional regulator [Pyrinomonadaceae bacterium]|nr:XRE family transcriptional regulator [Pyrinomonadaceae bacterium]
MPAQRAIIKPELLVWTREEAGLSIEDAAKKISKTPEQLRAAEQGESQLTVRQLRILSNAYKRPLAFFYLPQPPAKTVGLRDFRRPPQEISEPDSPRLLHEVRRARYRRTIALQLLEELGESISPFTTTATLQDQTADVAVRLRDLLGVSRTEQKHFPDEYAAFNAWREAIERANVAVFQTTSVSNREMLGFSLSEPLLPVIVLNVKDAPVRRIFTMLHEMVHLMLRTGGICTLREVQAIEVFCNEVAGEALVPQAWLLAETVVRDHGRQTEWPDGLIQALARRYRVSRETILRRLLVAGYTTQRFYEAKREQYKLEYEARVEAAARQIKESDKEIRISPSTVAVYESGRMFIQLVLESYRRDKITLSQVSDYLEVRTKHLDRIARAVNNPALEIGAA